MRALSGKLMELITMGSTQLDFAEVSVEELFRAVECALTPLFSGKAEIDFLPVMVKVYHCFL